MTIAASAFPRLSPSGRRVVAGERVIVVDRTIEVGPGIGAQWADEVSIYYVRQPDGALMFWRDGTAPSVVRPVGFNTYSAAGVDHWAGADDLGPGPRVTFSSGFIVPGWSGPALSEDRGVWAALVQQTGAIQTSHGQPTRYAAGNCRELRWYGRAIAWGVLQEGRWQIAGQLEIGGSSAPTLLNVEPEEFWPVPLLVGATLWLLTHSHDRLLLRPWGHTHGYVVATGRTSYPDAKRLPDGRIRVVWDAGHDVLGEAVIDPAAPRVDLRPIPPVDPPPVEPPTEENMNPPGVQIDFYGAEIAPGKPWLVKFHDRNSDWAGAVEIVNNSVHVMLRNSKGEDRSGNTRPVTVRCDGAVTPPPVEPPVTPPVTPPATDLDRIDGQLQLENGGGFAVHGRPVLPILCHFGDALSRWSRGQQTAVAHDLDDITAAGYHGVRFWSTLGLDDHGGGYWAGRAVGPTYTASYWDHVQAFLEALRARGLVCQFSLGDTRPVAVPDLRDYAYRAADRINAVGSHVVALGLEVNEDRDTGHQGAAKLAEFNGWFRERCPDVLVGLSAYTGTEDVAILNDYSRAPANAFVCHGYRGGHWWDKVRHAFSLQYEGKPQKRNGWQGEPPGPGSRVSAIDHKDELDADAMCALTAMHLLTRQASVYFTGPGVISDEGERLQDMPGFREVPKVRALLPADVMRYDELFHGGETWAAKRIFAAQGEVRADHAHYRDGRFVCLIYGPGSLDVPQTRAARIDVDHRFGNKARLVVGQA